MLTYAESGDAVVVVLNEDGTPAMEEVRVKIL